MNGSSKSVPSMADWNADYARIRSLIDLAGIAPLAVAAPETRNALTRWAGLSADQAIAASGRTHRQDMLRRSAELLADLGDGHATGDTVTALIPTGRGAGLELDYGIHPSPFGEMLILVTSAMSSVGGAGRLAGAAFRNDDIGQDERGMLADMQARWPAAAFRHDDAATSPVARRMFQTSAPGSPTPPNLALALIGTAFDIAVWRLLLQIPMGRAVTYQAIADRLGRPGAARAVGSAVGRNPISFTVPCHRVLRTDGALGGYHWGLTRKIAMHVWEAGRAT